MRRRAPNRAGEQWLSVTRNVLLLNDLRLVDWISVFQKGAL